ncbi:MAG: NAD(P)H-dependent glycerol-3-phosphate dehydrogenase [Candidatus Neomarinimicrobiota bacterium]|nr:NAD(P)H-dependent glycerol-3-phosphate dehydrogenase [Candidatus Neomarinimicrobiota bacterium]
MKVSVLGCGTWGSAVAQALADNGVEVTAWQRYENKSLEMESTRRHPILKDIEFNSNILFTSDFDNAIVSGNIIILAVPSDAVREVILQASDKLTENSIIVNLAKGIENNTLMTMSQVIHIESGLKANQIVSLYGPSHAEEVVKKLPTTLVAGCVEKNTSILIQELMSSEFLRIYTNDDILGVEIGGSLKNIMAIAAGVCDGIGYGDNSKAAILTRGMNEMTKLGLIMGANESTFFGLSGIGDLLVTALSKHSRNRFVGEKIGKGESLDSIMGSMKMVAEGINTCKAIPDLVKKYKIEMPISESIHDILFNKKDPLKVVKELMTRKLGPENN